MGRALVVTFVIGLVLLAAGMLTITVEASVGTALMVIGFLVLVPVPFLINLTARRSPGWTRVWRPGAARREYEAELAAREHGRGPEGTDGVVNGRGAHPNP